MGAVQPQGAARRRARRGSRASRNSSRRRTGTKPIDSDVIQIPPGPRLGSRCSRSTRSGRASASVCSSTAGRSPLHRRHRRNHGPNGVGKTTLVQDGCRSGAADADRFKVGESVEFSYVDQSGAASTPRRLSGRSSPTGSTTSRSARPRSITRLRRVVGFKVSGPAKAGGVLSGGEVTASTLALTLKARRHVLPARRADQRSRCRDAASSRTHSKSSPGAPSSSATTGGSSTRSRRTCSRGRARGQAGPVVLVRGWLQRLREQQGGAPRRGSARRTVLPTAASAATDA